MSTQPEVLDANKLFELEYLDEFNLCLVLLNAVMNGYEWLVWSAQGDEDSFYGVDVDGRKHPYFLLSDPVARLSQFQDQTTVVEQLANLEPSVPGEGRFMFEVGDHRLDVQVERSGDRASPAVRLRLPGVGEARESAKVLLEKSLEYANGRPVRLSLDGERTRIVGHGTLKFRERLAMWVEIGIFAALPPVLMGTCSYLFSKTEGPETVGWIGWVLCAAMGYAISILGVRVVFQVLGIRGAGASWDFDELVASKGVDSGAKPDNEQKGSDSASSESHSTV